MCGTVVPLDIYGFGICCFTCLQFQFYSLICMVSMFVSKTWAYDVSPFL